MSEKQTADTPSPAEQLSILISMLGHVKQADDQFQTPWSDRSLVELKLLAAQTTALTRARSVDVAGEALQMLNAIDL